MPDADDEAGEDQPGQGEEEDVPCCRFASVERTDGLPREAVGQNDKGSADAGTPNSGQPRGMPDDHDAAHTHEQGKAGPQQPRDRVPG